MSTRKKKLHADCRGHIQQRIDAITEAQRLLQQSANEETKSSAGDKYETGRAMAQNEMEKLGLQLAENRRQLNVLDQIDPTRTADTVQLGSLVETSQGNFYIAVSAGALGAGTDACMAISPAAPIGAKLLGRKAGETVQFNNRNYQIIVVE